jgi:hypothetical protein
LQWVKPLGIEPTKWAKDHEVKFGFGPRGLAPRPRLVKENMWLLGVQGPKTKKINVGYKCLGKKYV